MIPQFFTGAFGGVIFGLAGFIAEVNIGPFAGPAVPLTAAVISVLLGVMAGIGIAKKTAMTREARIIPWLGIGFFLLPPVLLVGAIGRLAPKISDPMESLFILFFMIGIMATAIVLSALISGAIKWRNKRL